MVPSSGSSANCPSSVAAAEAWPALGIPAVTARPGRACGEGLLPRPHPQHGHCSAPRCTLPPSTSRRPLHYTRASGGQRRPVRDARKAAARGGGGHTARPQGRVHEGPAHGPLSGPGFPAPRAGGSGLPAGSHPKVSSSGARGPGPEASPPPLRLPCASLAPSPSPEGGCQKGPPPTAWSWSPGSCSPWVPVRGGVTSCSRLTGRADGSAGEDPEDRQSCGRCGVRVSGSHLQGETFVT